MPRRSSSGQATKHELAGFWRISRPRLLRPQCGMMPLMSAVDGPEEAFGIDQRVWDAVFGPDPETELNEAILQPSLFLMAAALSPEMLSERDELEYPKSLSQAVSIAEASGFEDPEARVKRCLRSLAYWAGSGYKVMAALSRVDSRLTSWCASHVAVEAMSMIADKRRFIQEIFASRMAIDLFERGSTNKGQQDWVVIEVNASMIYNTSEVLMAEIGRPSDLVGYACLSAYHALMTDVYRRQGESTTRSGQETVFYFSRVYASNKGETFNALLMEEGYDRSAQIIADAIWTYPLPRASSGRLSGTSPILSLAAGAAIGAALGATMRRR